MWEGDRPSSGLSAAARLARHRLLAEAARTAGAAVVLMGHTADDRAEARAMREEGSSVPTPRPWSPSPVWPEGRGLFLLRPLLGERRVAIRAALAAAGESWIDDPANIDPRGARARARLHLAGAGPCDEPVKAPDAIDLTAFVEGPAADLAFVRADLLRRPNAAADLGAALLCASGGDRPPRSERLARLLDRLRGGEAFRATLAGARIESDGVRARLTRDIADRRGGEATDLALPAGAAVVWDGRIELAAAVSGARVGALAARAARLPPSLARALKSLAPSVRAALPLVTHADGRSTLPTLRPDVEVAARALARERLAAARGAIANEEALRL